MLLWRACMIISHLGPDLLLVGHHVSLLPLVLHEYAAISTCSSSVGSSAIPLDLLALSSSAGPAQKLNWWQQ